MPTFADPYSGLGEGISAAAESWTKSIKEADEAKRKAAGADLVADHAFKTGVINADTYANFHKSSPQQKASMLGSFIALERYKEQERDNARAEEAAKRAATALDYQRQGLDVSKAGQALSERRFTVEQQAEKDKQAAIAANIAAGPQLVTKAGRTFQIEPSGTFKDLPEQAPTVPYRLPGQKPIRVPATSELGQKAVAEMDPQRQIYDKYGLTPDDILQTDKVQFGSYEKGTGFEKGPDWTHVSIKGNVLPIGDYNAMVRRLIDTGQTGTKPVQLTTGQTIEPKPQQQVKKLDLQSAQYFIKQAGGDVDAAKQLAADAGYEE